MIDFHTHILPEMDDGASSIEESVQMICAMADQGIKHIMATPHFYARRENIDSFLARRADAAERMREALKIAGRDIKVHLGAEVHYYEGISRTKDITKLKIEDTNVLLLEMPFQKWTENMYNEIQALQSSLGCTVMLAHIERYLEYNGNAFFERIFDTNSIIQSNAEFFMGSWFQRQKALKLVKNGYIDIISSDSHNMTTRKPVLWQAFDIIENKLGSDYSEELINNSYKLLSK